MASAIYATHVMNQGSEGKVSEASIGKVRSPNWTDVGSCRSAITVNAYKEYFPISKTNNSTVWERISKQLNQLLVEQYLLCIRTAPQCKAKIKDLEDEYKYKRVKDYIKKRENDRITFSHFDNINEILGCKPSIIPTKVAECGFLENLLSV